MHHILYPSVRFPLQFGFTQPDADLHFYASRTAGVRCFLCMIEEVTQPVEMRRFLGTQSGMTL